MKSFFKLREDTQFCCEECVDDSVYGSVEENFEVTGDEQYEDWDLEENLTGYSTSNISTRRDPKTYQTRELGKLGYTKRSVKTRSTVGNTGGYSLATRQHSMVSNNTLVKRSPLNQSVDEPNAESIVNEEMHKVSVTVIDPNHTMVSMRKEPIQKTVKVKALDKDNAIYKATQYYKDRGYKVKEHNYVSLAEVKQTWPGHSDTVKNPNFNDELSIRRIGPMGRRLKSGKLSADERGQQERTKTLMKFTKLRGGLTGPKGILPEGERGLWDNIHAKRKRIKNGSGERMRTPGSKGAPTPEALKASQTNEEVTYKPATGNLHRSTSGHTVVGYSFNSNGTKNSNIVKHGTTGKYFAAGGSSLHAVKSTTFHDTPEAAAKSKQSYAKDAVKSEEVVNELSSDTLQNYKEKAKVSADNLTAKGEYKKSTDRWLNVMKATGKQIDKTTAGIRKNLNKEEVKEIDELNKDTLYSYSNKANKDMNKRYKELGAQIRADKSVEANKNSMKIGNRNMGLDRAETRLNKEGAIVQQEKE